MNQVRAKKGLGQHFLTDRNIAGKIVGSLEEGNFQSVVEIGPGTGILTDILFQKDFPEFTAIELDKESVAYLRVRYPDKQDAIIHADFLSYPLEKHKTPLALIGNLPYFITAPIFFRVLQHRNIIGQVVCMIQKEVAERIAAPPGNKTYGILSVLLQAFFKIEYLFTVNERCFIPPPKVKSAVIRLKRDMMHEPECDFSLFQKVVKATFNQRRKVIRNSLKSIFVNLPVENELLAERPEQLTVSDFAELTRLIASLNQKIT